MYINSGVLLLNMKAFREEHFTEHFLNVMNKHYFACIAPDQDYLNMICRDRILYLDETWNAMPKDHQYDAEKTDSSPIGPTIICFINHGTLIM